MHAARKDNNVRIPYDMESNIINSSKDMFPWINRNVIKKYFQNHVEHCESTTQSAVTEAQEATDIMDHLHESNGSQEISSNYTEINQSKGCHPKDATTKKKNFIDLATTAFVNKVAAKFSTEKENINTRTKRGRFDEIVAEARALRNIEKSAKKSKAAIDRRIQRRNLEFNCEAGGKSSPLTKHEDYFVEMIVKLSHGLYSITSGKGLSLINYLMKGTGIEVESNIWKLKSTCAQDVTKVTSTFGQGHWRGFVNRNSNRIISKRGAKFELNRKNWSAHNEFFAMKMASLMRWLVLVQ